MNNSVLYKWLVSSNLSISVVDLQNCCIRVTTNLENLAYSGISMNAENLGNS